MEIVRVVQVAVNCEDVGEHVVEDERILAGDRVLGQQAHHAIAVLEARQLGGQSIKLRPVGREISELMKLD